MNDSRYLQIQGIRALAVLGIFLSHSYLFIGLDYIRPLLPGIEKLGPLGVTTFFMISGFLFSLKGKEIAPSNNIIKAAWKRIERLYPLHLAMLVLAFIGKFHFTTRALIIYSISLPFQLTLTQDFVPWVGVIDSYNGPSWYLSAFWGVWMIIYLCPGIINKIISFNIRQCIKWIIILGFLQVIYHYMISIIPEGRLPFKPTWYYDFLEYRNVLLCLVKFVVGAFFGKILSCYKPSITKQNITQTILLAMAMLSLFYLDLGIFRDIFYEVLIGMGFICVWSNKSLGGAFLSSPFMTYLGDISGYFFLIHGAINFVLMRFVFDKGLINSPYIFILALIVSLSMSSLYKELIVEKRKK